MWIAIKPPQDALANPLPQMQRELEGCPPHERCSPWDAARGAQLFKGAVRGFGRCSTCHEVGGLGISVAAPIAQAPALLAALKVLATPNVKTGTVGGESMPVLASSSDGKAKHALRTT